MGKNESRRLNPTVLAEDLEILAALRGIRTYIPANPAFTVDAIDAINNRRVAANDNEVQISTAYDTARDSHIAVQWELHNALLSVKNQVAAQFGPDSNELQAMKLKEKSEYKNRLASWAQHHRQHQKPKRFHRPE